MHHSVHVCFAPPSDTFCTGFYPSGLIFASEAIPFWYRLLEPTAEQIGCQVLIQTLGSYFFKYFPFDCYAEFFFSSQCFQNISITRHTTFDPIRSFPIRWPFAGFAVLSPDRQFYSPDQISFRKLLILDLLIVIMQSSVYGLQCSSRAHSRRQLKSSKSSITRFL